jgi:hypothetical protein
MKVRKIPKNCHNNSITIHLHYTTINYHKSITIHPYMNKHIMVLQHLQNIISMYHFRNHNQNRYNHHIHCIKLDILFHFHLNWFLVLNQFHLFSLRLNFLFFVCIKILLLLKLVILLYFYSFYIIYIIYRKQE